MISLLVATNVHNTCINFNKLEKNNTFQIFYQELWYDSDFLQEFFDEPIWKVNNQFCFTLN
jgi:hypothetical protein